MIKQLFKGDEALLKDWMDKAMLDDAVWPHLNAGQRYIRPDWELKNDDWNFAFFLNGPALLKLFLDRSQGNTISCGLWCLKNSHDICYIAGLLSIVPGLCKRWGMNYLEGGCSANNEQSLRLHTKIFGDSCGSRVAYYWNPLTGCYETQLSFRGHIDDIMNRYNPNNENPLR